MGAPYTTKGTWTTNSPAELEKASAAFNQRLGDIWNNKTFSLKMKLSFDNSNVLSMLLFGCETWHPKTSQEKKLDAFDTKYLRQILGIPWSDFVSSDAVREQDRQPPVSSTVCQPCLSRLGHVLRLPPSRLAKDILSDELLLGEEEEENQR